MNRRIAFKAVGKEYFPCTASQKFLGEILLKSVCRKTCSPEFTGCNVYAGKSGSLSAYKKGCEAVVYATFKIFAFQGCSRGDYFRDLAFGKPLPRLCNFADLLGNSYFFSKTQKACYVYFACVIGNSAHVAFPAVGERKV